MKMTDYRAVKTWRMQHLDYPGCKMVFARATDQFSNEIFIATRTPIADGTIIPASALTRTDTRGMAHAYIHLYEPEN